MTTYKVFYQKNGEVYEETKKVSYTYIQTTNTIHVERKRQTSNPKPTRRSDIIGRFQR